METPNLSRIRPPITTHPFSQPKVNQENNILIYNSTLTDLHCTYYTVTVKIADAFHELCRDVHVARRKNKTSLLDRVLGGKVGGQCSGNTGVISHYYNIGRHQVLPQGEV